MRKLLVLLCLAGFCFGQMSAENVEKARREYGGGNTIEISTYGIKKARRECEGGNTTSCGVVHILEGIKHENDVLPCGCNKYSCIKQDYSETFEYYKRGCDDGNVRSCAIVSEVYYYGEGVEQNYFKAFEYYIKVVMAGIMEVVAWLLGHMNMEKV